jgi:GAF domain-containing protein
MAIENTRLFEAEQQRTRELTESLEQQTAITGILRVISNSPNDVQPVLDSVAEYAARICEAQVVDIVLAEDDKLRTAAIFGQLEAVEFRVNWTAALDRSTVSGRSVCDRQSVHVADLQNAGDEFALGREFAIKHGHRTTLAVPLIREDRALGTILVRRTEVRPFEQKHIALLTTFADQAAIAIENVRLFEAEQQRTRELSESLEQQTATSKVLQVISRSAFDLEAVLNTLVESAARVCKADRGIILRPTGKNASYYYAASYGHAPEFIEQQRTLTFEPGRGGASGRVLMERRSVQIADVLADPEYTFREAAKLGNFRTILGVPLLREGTPIGIFLLHRAAVRPFTEKQIKLVETFADQAVIAIENVRLFEAEQQRTRELSESLEQQMATSEVLKVISTSPGALQPVFETILQNAVRICGAKFGNLWLCEGDFLRIGAKGSGQRSWRSSRSKRKDVQSLLHDQARRRRHRPWSVHHSRHHREATFRVYRGRHPARRVHRN